MSGVVKLKGERKMERQEETVTYTEFRRKENKETERWRYNI